MGIPVCDRPGYRDHDDRAQVAALAASATVTIKRAAWDALLTRIDELERRVGSNDRKIARLVRAKGRR